MGEKGVASASVGDGEPAEVGRETHNVLFCVSRFGGVSFKGKVENGELFLTLPTAIVGNGEIELVLEAVPPFIALAYVGKGKENGKSYFPEANRPSALCPPALPSASLV